MSQPVGISGRWFVSIFGVILLGCMLAVVAFAWRAQSRFAAMVLACEAVEQYVSSHEGRWPTAWGELSPFVPESAREQVRTVIAIDFAADGDKIATQPGLIFSAIKPLGICYQAYEKPIMSVVDALKKFRTPPPSLPAGTEPPKP